MRKKERQIVKWSNSQIVQNVQIARSRLKAAPTGESLFAAFFKSAIRNPQSSLCSMLYARGVVPSTYYPLLFVFL